MTVKELRDNLSKLSQEYDDYPAIVGKADKTSFEVNFQIEIKRVNKFYLFPNLLSFSRISSSSPCFFSGFLN